VATLASRARFLEREPAWRHLFSDQFEPRDHVILERAAGGRVTATNGATGRIVSARYTPQQVEATTDADGPMFLVLSQTFHPGWAATIDGQPAPILSANVAFQAIEVPAGQHNIALRFRPRSFQAGVWISGATLLGLLVVVARRVRVLSPAG
jgi:uncharacterized membrane protein YfhO